MQWHRPVGATLVPRPAPVTADTRAVTPKPSLLLVRGGAGLHLSGRAAS